MGTVAQLMYREAEWPADKVAPYQIELDSGHFIYAQVDMDELVRPIVDILTLQDLAMHLATARAKYLNNTGVPDEVVCRLMLTTRMEGLPLCRVRVATSSLLGQGLFATRDIAEGELITLYPADAAFVWEDKERSEESNVKIFFGKHIPADQRDERVTEWPDVVARSPPLFPAASCTAPSCSWLFCISVGVQIVFWCTHR